MVNIDYSKQDFLALVSAAIEKLKVSEPELSKALEEKLVHPELKVDVPRGKLVCGTGFGGTQTVFVGLETKDGDYLDFYLAESGRESKDAGHSEEDIIAYVWEDVEDEDYTRKLTYDEEAFQRYERAVKGNEER